MAILAASVVSVVGAVLATGCTRTMDSPNASTADTTQVSVGKGESDGGRDQNDADQPLASQVPAIKVPRDTELTEELKDENQYWDTASTKKLIQLAKEGDEWAIREIAWPKGHPLHEKGRPYFRNTGPHPDGLFPHSGF